jgi:hypothetical protein
MASGDLCAVIFSSGKPNDREFCCLVVVIVCFEVNQLSRFRFAFASKGLTPNLRESARSLQLQRRRGAATTEGLVIVIVVEVHGAKTQHIHGTATKHVHGRCATASKPTR